LYAYIFSLAIPHGLTFRIERKTSTAHGYEGVLRQYLRPDLERNGWTKSGATILKRSSAT
jgi:hypothetical protein